jgi:hypothetical protein
VKIRSPKRLGINDARAKARAIVAALKSRLTDAEAEAVIVAILTLRAADLSPHARDAVARALNTLREAP